MAWDEEQRPQDCPVSMLSDELLREGIFSFVGMNHYRFVAGTCRRFREIYTQWQREQHTKVYDTDYHGHCFTITSMPSVLESLARASIYRDDSGAEASRFARWVKEKGAGKDIAAKEQSTFSQKHCLIRSGRLEIWRKMRWQYATTSGAAFLRTHAVKHGKLEVLQWIAQVEPKEATAQLTSAVPLCQLAAHNGDLDVLQWLRTHGYPWDSTTCYIAARGGHLEVLQWARRNACAWDTLTCAEAAAGGHLEVLQWARSNGCEWNAAICSLAARFGHLEILKWARLNGCEWDSHTISNAVNQGHDEIVQWARENGCPQPEFGGDY
jgi:hypothetical protein